MEGVTCPVSIFNAMMSDGLQADFEQLHRNSATTLVSIDCKLPITIIIFFLRAYYYNPIYTINLPRFISGAFTHRQPTFGLGKQTDDE
jgi:hypothetical protein